MRKSPVLHPKLRGLASGMLALALLLPMLTVAAPPAAAAASDCKGLQIRRISYSQTSGTLKLEGCGETFTPSDIHSFSLGQVAKGHAPVIEPVSDPAQPGQRIWLLKVKTMVYEGATLHVHGGEGGDTDWLRLRSEDAYTAYLRTDNGALDFQDTRVTSWDPTTNAFDMNFEKAGDPVTGEKQPPSRAYIAARSVYTTGRETAAPTSCEVGQGTREPYEASMSIANSEMDHLGSYADEAYGVTWKVYHKLAAGEQPLPDRGVFAKVDVFGDVSNSSFHHNQFGVYTYGSLCQDFTKNEFSENVMYGLDPHDDSDYMTVTGNTFKDNGNHGFICSVYCNNLVVRDNLAQRNLHGIMIHRRVDGAIIENNTSEDNRDAGIAIFDSRNAVVRNNISRNNAISAVRLSVGSAGNLIENNQLIGRAAAEAGNGYVVYSYAGSDRAIGESGAEPPTAADMELRRPKQNTFRNNTITGYKGQVIKMGDASDNLFQGNTISGVATGSGMDFPNGVRNTATGNRFLTPLAVTYSTTSPSTSVGAASTIIRDGEVGKAVILKLDAEASVQLRDSRANIFRLPDTGYSTSATAAGSVLDLKYADPGISNSEKVETLDFSVRPQRGTVKVKPNTWQTTAPYGKSWVETSTDASGSVAHSVGNLQAGARYQVNVNGAALGCFAASSQGRIAFSYAGGYAGSMTFTVGACTATTTTEKFQETSTAITYTGTWKDSKYPTFDGGQTKYGSLAGAKAAFTFTGTSVTWTTTKSTNRGKADVYLDGAKVATVDLYRSALATQQVGYSKTGLSNGQHTLEIRPLGQKHASSTGTHVDVDSFTVQR